MCREQCPQGLCWTPPGAREAEAGRWPGSLRAARGRWPWGAGPLEAGWTSPAPGDLGPSGAPRAAPTWGPGTPSPSWGPPQPRRDRGPSPGPGLAALTQPALQPAEEQMEGQGVETAEGFGEGKRWMEGGHRPGVARWGGLVCTSPSAEPWEQRLWGCQWAGHSGRSGWALPERASGTLVLRGPPEAAPPSERLPPVPAGAVVTEAATNPTACLEARWCEPGECGEPPGAGRCAGRAPGKLARDGAPCHLWALGVSRACSPFLGGPRQRVARRGPSSPARKGAHGPGSVAQRGGKGMRSWSVAWAGCQQVPRPLQTHREGAQGSVGPQAPELSPAGGGPGLIRARDLAP